MPTFRKVTPEELLNELPYRQELSQFDVGDVVEIKLGDGETWYKIGRDIETALKSLGWKAEYKTPRTGGPRHKHPDRVVFVIREAKREEAVQEQ